jgi:predicted O-methyltransferase YrrM
MYNYNFTTDWFQNSSLKGLLLDLVNPLEANQILEIGSYEGASACFIADNLLDHEESFLICVDPFSTDDSTTIVNTSTIEIYKKNIAESKNYKKIKFNQQFSKDFFEKNTIIYNFIYIDGSHTPEDITLDFEYSLKFISKNGIIWMDDYGGGDGSSKTLIDKLFEKHSDNLKIIHKGYQIGFQKK